MKKTIQFAGTVECIKPDFAFTVGKQYHVNQGYIGAEHRFIIKDNNDKSRSMTEAVFDEHFKVISPTYNVSTDDEDPIKTNIYR